MLRNAILARLDGSAVALILASAAIIVSILAAILRRRGLAAADKALAEGRFSDAIVLFVRVAKAEFYFVRRKRKGTPTFERALAGLERVFLAAGRPVDFARLRELNADLVALHADKKYRSVDAIRACLNADGWKIRTRIATEAMAFFDNLPTLKAYGGVHPENPIRPQNTGRIGPR